MPQLATRTAAAPGVRPHPTAVTTPAHRSHRLLLAYGEGTSAPVSPALRELADAAVEASLRRPFTPWRAGAPNGDVDPGVELGRILSWLDRQPGPAGPDAASHLIRTYVDRYRGLHPEVDEDDILQGIAHAVREPTPYLPRIRALHRQPPPPSDH